MNKNSRGLIDIAWHGCRLWRPGWDDPNSRALGFTLAGFEQDPDIHVMMNMYWEPLDFELLSVPGRSWFRSIDTALLPPDDIADPGAEVADFRKFLPGYCPQRRGSCVEVTWRMQPDLVRRNGTLLRPIRKLQRQFLASFLRKAPKRNCINGSENRPRGSPLRHQAAERLD